MTNTIPKRPIILTDEMKQRAARQVAEALRKFGHIEESQIDDSVRDIARVGYAHMDGYQLAKALDERCYWDCDMSMLDELDTWSSAAKLEIKAAQQKWVEDNKIEPPFPVGTRVIARWGGEDHTGTIDEVYAHGVAQYAVKVDNDSDPTRRIIVDFEDARAEQVDAPA